MSFDAIIIGSGPASISAVVPLLNSGKRVLMLDWGNTQDLQPPRKSHYKLRGSDSKQHRWMIGREYYTLKNIASVSPKLRVPTLNYVFEGFDEYFNTETSNFFVTGSLAKGGLSNAWGAGVAALSPNHLIKEYGSNYREMLLSYSNVAARMGISGKNEDRLSSYFGVDKWAREGTELDELPRYMLDNCKESNPNSDVYFGRSRVAVLTEDANGRKKCEKLGNCLWGCTNKSIYSSKYDLDDLKDKENFTYLSGIKVENLVSNNDIVTVEAYDSEGNYKTFSAASCFLGAGTLSSTKILVKALKLINCKISIQSCPTAAFLLFIPRFLGRKVLNSEFGLGQVSFRVKLSNKLNGFGSFFGTQGLPLFEFVRYLPIGMSSGIKFLSKIMSSCLVGNLFLPGTISKSYIEIDSSGNMSIKGEYDQDLYLKAGSEAKRKLTMSLLKKKCFIVPFSFKFTESGACIHYASTFPISSNSEIASCKQNGEVSGLDNVYLIDGASLPSLSEKSHTLTIMANADRIARAYLDKSHV